MVHSSALPEMSDKLWAFGIRVPTGQRRSNPFDQRILIGGTYHRDDPVVKHALVILFMA